MDSTLCVVLVGNRITKIHQEPIPKELSDMSCVALDDFSTHPLILPDDVSPILWIELTR
jgi:hypothetical protein